METQEQRIRRILGLQKTQSNPFESEYEDEELMLTQPAEDDRTRRLRDLLEQYQMAAPDRAERATDLQNKSALMGSASRAASKFGTLGGKEAGSGLTQEKFGIQDPQILNPQLMKMAMSPQNTTFPKLQMQLEKERANKSYRDKSLVLREEAQEKTQTERDSNRDERSRERINRDVAKISDSFSYARKIGKAIDDLENQLGVNLEDLDINTDTDEITVRGRKVDFPGTNVFPFGRQAWYSKVGASIDSYVSGIINPLIKELSGSAVTGNEFGRVAREFGQSKFSTEALYFKRLQDLKRGLGEATREEIKKFSPEAVDEFQKRGGRTDFGYTDEKIRPVEIEMYDGLSRTQPKTNNQIIPRTGNAKFINRMTGEKYQLPFNSIEYNEMINDPQLEEIQ